MSRIIQLFVDATAIGVGNHDYTYKLPDSRCIIRSLWVYFTAPNAGDHVLLCTGTSYVVGSLLCGGNYTTYWQHPIQYTCVLVPSTDLTVRVITAGGATDFHVVITLELE